MDSGIRVVYILSTAMSMVLAGIGWTSLEHQAPDSVDRDSESDSSSHPRRHHSGNVDHDTSEFPCGRGSLTGGGPHWWRKDRTRAGSPSKHHTTMNNIVFTTSHVSGFMVHFLDSRHSGYKLSSSGVARLCQENSTSPGRYRRHFLCRQVSLSQRHDDCGSPILSGPRLFPSSTNFLW